MFYETAQTIGPGWHSRSYKPAHYEDMSWSPSSRQFRPRSSSPENYRRIIHPEDDFPATRRLSNEDDEDFFGGRRSPTFPRRIFKEAWNDSSPSNHRFGDRPRMFKRVFRPSEWEDDFNRDMPSVRRVDRDFDKDFDSRFGSPRDLQKDIEEEFEKSSGRVHRIPIMVERRMEEIKSKFGRNSPPPAKEEEEDTDEWLGPQVHRLRKTFEPESDGFYSRHRGPRSDFNAKPRGYTSSSETWDPHSVNTLPTRKSHKASQSFDDARDTAPPKSVFRSFSETHEDLQKPQQQPQHSAAFRSHSDGHCPNQTYVTKIEVNVPNKETKEDAQTETAAEEQPPKVMKSRSCKFGGDNMQPMQQIAVVMQNVEDLVRRVEAYSGTGRDKHFRFLDEMLTRCMLRLDDVDTEGREDIRNARKAAVRQVQSCIERLEVKADESERRHRGEPAQSQEESKTEDEGEVEDPQKAVSDESQPAVNDEGNDEEQPKTNFDVFNEPIPLKASEAFGEPIPLKASEDAIPLKASEDAIPLKASEDVFSEAIPLKASEDEQTKL